MNLDILADASGGDPGFERQLARDYLDFMAEELRVLHAALERGSAADVARGAHLAMGSSLTCGALTLAAVLGELEVAGNAGALERVPTLLADAEREFARVHEILEALPSRQADAGVLP